MNSPAPAPTPQPETASAPAVESTLESAIETPSGKNKDTENFPVGSFLIRADLRPHVHAFYNFARASDDIADNPLLYPSDKIGRLTHFEKVLLGESDDLPVAVAMRQSLAETKISPEHCLDLIRAFKQDAIKFRYKSWDELLDYCRYSASPVGRYVLALHGVGGEAWQANDALCSVLQVVNHLQDCADDYRELDRVYLPQDEMDAFGADITMLSRETTAPELRKVIERLLNYMAPMMVDARNLPRFVPDLRLKLETAIIAALADDMITRLRSRDPIAENARLTKPGKVMAVLKGLFRAFR